MNGEVAEWSKALVSKTSVPPGTQGSNPCLSAINFESPGMRRGFFVFGPEIACQTDRTTILIDSLPPDASVFLLPIENTARIFSPPNAVVVGHSNTMTPPQPALINPKPGEVDMADKGSKDKGNKETKKKPQRTQKEKRKDKAEKKKK